ncbi:MAG: hypothetical protein IKH56_10240 [Oscillospiraceae bacterium]|nr:hypothetical protein [Oscillospiraceae bacterium]
MKKVLALMMALILVLSLAGCSLTGLKDALFGKKQEAPADTEPVPQEEPAEPAPAEETPDPGEEASEPEPEEEGPVTVELSEIRSAVEEEVTASLNMLETIQQRELSAEKPDVKAWTLTLTAEADAAYGRILARTEAGYLLTAGLLANDENVDWKTAMAELNALWNAAADRYYDGWDDLREKGRDSLPAAVGDVTKLYDTCWADGFQAYTAGWNAMHTEQQAVEAALAAGDTDLSPILSRLAQERAEEQARRQEERTKKAEQEQPEEPEPEEEDAGFRAMMDGYEAFFDECAAFIEEYQNSEDPMSMMKQYQAYVQKSEEIFRKINDIDVAALSEADRAYYQQVMARIYEKLSVEG